MGHFSEELLMLIHLIALSAIPIDLRTTRTLEFGFIIKYVDFVDLSFIFLY
jgi:hypothetical protein